MELINGMMEELILDNGKIIKCMVKVYFIGKMEDNIKVNILMIKKRVTAYLNGLMEDNIKEPGKQENKMVKEYM